jgi:glucose-6-phosphate 1-dehydrogenase
MSHSYHEAFPDTALPDAYERLLLDALKGDAALFARNDGIENAWRLMDPIIQGWDASPQNFPLETYPRGGWGPEAASALLAKGGHAWRMGCCGLPCN